MKHIHSLAQAVPDRPTCLTIGGFDGVHRGHARVIKRLLETAQKHGYRTAALTFFPLPKQVLNQPQRNFYLTLPEERARLLYELGVDLVITHPFDNQVREIRALDFITQLVAHLDTREIWVGPDFALGYRREGSVPFLREHGKKLGFRVETVDFFRLGWDDSPGLEPVVSSTLIRTAIREGRIRDANRCLGRPFGIWGAGRPEVRRDAQDQFPSALLSFWQEHAVPPFGFYAGFVVVGGRQFKVVIHVGTESNMDAAIPSISFYLLDGPVDLDRSELFLTFIERLGDGRRLDTPETFHVQLDRHARQVRDLLAGLQV